MAANTLTRRRRITNSNLGRVLDPVVCDTGRQAAFPESADLFHSLGSSVVLLGNVKGAMSIDPRREAKGGLSCITSKRTRVHGGQRDEYQRQNCSGRDHGGSVKGYGQSEDLSWAFKGLTVIVFFYLVRSRAAISTELSTATGK